LHDAPLGTVSEVATDPDAARARAPDVRIDLGHLLAGGGVQFAINVEQDVRAGVGAAAAVHHDGAVMPPVVAEIDRSDDEAGVHADAQPADGAGDSVRVDRNLPSLAGAPQAAPVKDGVAFVGLEGPRHLYPERNGARLVAGDTGEIAFHKIISAIEGQRAAEPAGNPLRSFPAWGERTQGRRSGRLAKADAPIE